MSWGLLDLSDNGVFKNVLNAEVAKQFDGDDNVLFVTLNDELAKQNIDLEDLMTASLQAHGKGDLAQYLHNGIHGFPYGGDSAFPQVYIPFVEDVDLNSAPTVVPVYDDVDEATGLQKSGSSIEYVQVTESFAEQNLVWAVSVNETSTGKNGSGTPTGKGGGTGGTFRGWFVGDRYLRVDAANITDNKDKFLAGKDEVSYVGIIYRPNCQNVVPIHCDEFCKIAKNDLGTWQLAVQFAYSGTRDMSVAVYNDPTSDRIWEELYNETLTILLYEKDGRKKHEKSIQFIGGCPASVRQYKSKDSPYGTFTPQYSQFTNPQGNPNQIVHTLGQNQFRFLGYKF